MNPPRKKLSPAKRRVFFAVTLLVPIFLVLLLEGSLRLFNYGPDLSLFTTETIGGKTYHIMNRGVKSRYFARVGFDPSTSPDYFLMPKPAGTYRIFCLGGSTTVGYPYWYNGSFSSFLRDRLRRTFPEKHIDVINVGMTATNSFTVLDMAHDLLRYEPDLFLVYDGHNEFYGALGVASQESLGGSRWLIQAYLQAVHFRTFLLARDIYGSIAGLLNKSAEPSPSGTMMERLALGHNVPYGSSTYKNALTIFKENLADTRALCSKAGIPLVLSSQVSNLRDKVPFISTNDPSLTPAAKLAFHQSFNTGLEFWMKGQPDSALNAFRAALSIDSTHAEAHYRYARCLDALKHMAEARSEYQRARDLDQLRFRSSSEFNDAIAQAADGGIASFIDMEKIFRDNSPDSLIGNSLITEHLHPNSRGYFLMAKAYAEAMRERALLVPAEEWRARDTIDDQSLWNERPVTELDERLAARRTAILTSGWPFKPGAPTVDAVAQGDTLGQLVEKLTRGQSDWPTAHERAAEFYLRRNDPRNAAREYAAIIDQLPLISVQPYLKLAKIELDAGQIAAVRNVLTASLNVEPTVLAYRALGDIALNEGHAGDAAQYYEKIPGFPQTQAERVENGYLLSLAYARMNKPEKSRALLLEILKLRPNYQPAITLLVQLQQSAPN